MLFTYISPEKLIAKKFSLVLSAKFDNFFLPRKKELIFGYSLLNIKCDIETQLQKYSLNEASF